MIGGANASHSLSGRFASSAFVLERSIDHQNFARVNQSVLALQSPLSRLTLRVSVRVCECSCIGFVLQLREREEQKTDSCMTAELSRVSQKRREAERRVDVIRRQRRGHEVT